MYPELADKVVVVTGASGNLGQAVVQYFAQADAKLILLGRNVTRIREQFEDAWNPDWLALSVNISEVESINIALDTIKQQYEYIDILVNVAGGYASGNSLADDAESIWDTMITLNAKSVFLMSRAIATLMIEQERSGRIINVGAKTGLSGTANHAAYAASKAAVFRLTESLAQEYNPHHITVNAVIPLIIDTPQNRQAMPSANFESWVTPESLAGVIGFLASNAARDITGALIPVYGG